MTIPEIKQLAADRILSVVGEYVTLKPQGENEHVGLCPFHADTKPSLMVNPTKKVWACFACGRKGHGGFSFVEEKEHSDFFGTLRRVADILNVDLPEKRQIRFSSREERVDAVSRPEFVYKPFTDDELYLLGSPRVELSDDEGNPLLDTDGRRRYRPEWTGEELEKEFNLFSVAHYTLPPSSQSTTGKSIRRYSNETYPVFTYKYTDSEGEDWGRLYLPLNKRGSKFYYWPTGTPHSKDAIFADRQLADAITSYREKPSGHVKFGHVLICSGGTDAINAYKRCRTLPKRPQPDGSELPEQPIHVCWLGSETTNLRPDDFQMLEKLSHYQYICYDQDETGLRRMNEMAMRYITLRVVYLPQGMYTSTDGRCKDIRDFFKTYTWEGNKGYDFAKWMHTAQHMKFWRPKLDRKKEPTGRYELMSESIKQFASSNGIYTYVTPGQEKNFVEVKNNIVTLISAKDIESKVRGLMMDFVKNDIYHYDEELLNTIFKSKMITEKTMRGLREINLNFRYDASRQEFITFRNGTFRITADKVTKATPAEADFFVYEDKLIQHDFKPIDEQPFEVTYSPAYESMRTIRDGFAAGTTEWDKANRKLIDMPDINKYTLHADFSADTLSYIRFIYNTGRMYWRKEKRGEELTEDERREVDLHFINKCWSIGHLLRKHKESSKGIAILAIEAQTINNGDNEGRTGKSLFFRYLNKVRNIKSIGMRNVNVDRKGDTLLAGVREDYTDLVIFEDIKKTHKLDTFYNYVTEPMDVRTLFNDTVQIPYVRSPKIGLSSNYCPKLEGSTRGRLNIVAFSNYYHAKSPQEGLGEFSPRQEFGHELIDDYNDYDMNRLYNFFVSCIQLNMRFPDKIEPVMDAIELRSIEDELTQPVLDWMNRFFMDHPMNRSRYLDRPFWKDDVFEHFRLCFGTNFRDNVTSNTMRKRLLKYCGYKGWILNPDILYRTKSERDRRDYRGSREKDGVRSDDYFWYIQTGELDTETIHSFHNNTLDVLSTDPPKGTKKKPAAKEEMAENEE